MHEYGIAYVYALSSLTNFKPVGKFSLNIIDGLQL